MKIFFAEVIYIILLNIFVWCSVLHADELQIPFSCYPKQLQSKFSDRGYKLDLSANDRDEKSWGFLESKGSKFSIFTYNPATPKEMSDVMQIVGETK